MFVAYFILFNVFVLLYGENPNEDKRNAGELSKQKCKEYSQHAPSKSECQNLRMDPLLAIGPDFADDKEYPHVVRMGYKVGDKIEWLCEGSLISEQFVLTVAHCLQSSNGKAPEFVRAGVADLNDTQHSQDIKIQETIVHPDYNPPSYYNDIGLVKLEKKVHINHNVLPACLHTQKEFDSWPAIHCGWGLSGFLGFDSRLEEEVLDFHNQTKCNETYLTETGVYRRKYNDIGTILERLRKGIVPETMICVRSSWYDINNGVSSGGPLHVYSKEYECMYDIIGVGLIGKVFDNRLHGVFARISAYIPWIEEKVWK